ncbi:MAG: hypothetical protein R3E13_08010 [Alphaproteobacteria bacterium]
MTVINIVPQLHIRKLNALFQGVSQEGAKAMLEVMTKPPRGRPPASPLNAEEDTPKQGPKLQHFTYSLHGAWRFRNPYAPDPDTQPRLRIVPKTQPNTPGADQS